MKKTLVIIIIVVLALSVGGGGVFLAMQTREEKDYSFHYDPGEYFVTDIQTSRRLLKTDIILFMADSREQESYIENNHQIRNAIIFVLRNKDEEELMKPDIEKRLSDEIISRLNKEFATEDFLQIYFNEFVIQ